MQQHTLTSPIAEMVVNRWSVGMGILLYWLLHQKVAVLIILFLTLMGVDYTLGTRMRFIHWG